MEFYSSSTSSEFEEQLENACAIFIADETVRHEESEYTLNLDGKVNCEFSSAVCKLKENSKRFQIYFTLNEKDFEF